VEERGHLAFHISPRRHPQSGQGGSKRRGRNTSPIRAEWGALPDADTDPAADPLISAKAASIDGRVDSREWRRIRARATSTSETP
jgi:hypothetical protein